MLNRKKKLLKFLFGSRHNSHSASSFHDLKIHKWTQSNFLPNLMNYYRKKKNCMLTTNSLMICLKLLSSFLNYYCMNSLKSQITCSHTTFVIYNNFLSHVLRFTFFLYLSTFFPLLQCVQLHVLFYFFPFIPYTFDETNLIFL